MAPKKKLNKKGNDDWEAELGETVDPISTATSDAKAADSEHNEDRDESGVGPGGGGGLLAALKKNKSKKQKKGKVVEEDYLEGEDPPVANGFQDHEGTKGGEDLAAKVPEDATAEDVFATQPTKAKGGKEKQNKATEVAKADENGSEEEGGGLKSKKEKEKEKKEREKQRKKEQVCFDFADSQRF